MIVDFPEPDEPTSAVTVPGMRPEAHILQHRLAGFIREGHVLELKFAHDIRQRHRAARVFVLGPLFEHFARALEPRDSFRQLRADAHYLKYRRDHERQKRRVADELADRDFSDSTTW